MPGWTMMQAVAITDRMGFGICILSRFWAEGGHGVLWGREVEGCKHQLLHNVRAAVVQLAEAGPDLG